MDDYYGTEHYGPIGPPEGNKSSATTEPELIDDERYARAVANQGKQVTALSIRCAELESERDALAVENARRLSALAAVCVAAECTGEDGWQRCVICDEVAQSGATIRHADGCPIGHARRALNER